MAQLDPAHPVMGDADSSRGTPSGDHRAGAIEVGWLLWGTLEPIDREAAIRARDRMRERLAALFPGYRWKLPVIERRDIAQHLREEPVILLEAGLAERDLRHWDFVLVVTGADLASHAKPFALAVPSRVLGVAVLSTVRIDPLAGGESADTDRAERCERMSRRLEALALHSFGHLNGLMHDLGSAHESNPRSAMRDIHSVRDLDAIEGYSDEAIEQLMLALPQIADLRLEEQSPDRSRRGWLAFCAHAAWKQAGHIAGAVRQSTPWMLPFRLSRLTTAALSAVVVLTSTAEIWELSIRQDALGIVILAAAVLCVAASHLFVRQSLVRRRRNARLTEQVVATDLATAIGVAVGMGTTLALLVAGTMAYTYLVFPPSLVAGWASIPEAAVGPADYGRVAGFVGALGLGIGVLGASFEQQHRLRHLAYVDEET